jgi:hypothetical protein
MKNDFNEEKARVRGCQQRSVSHPRKIHAALDMIDLSLLWKWTKKYGRQKK